MSTETSPVGISEIISEFESFGWEHLGTAVMETPDCPTQYASIYSWVKVTTMIFRMTGKALVIRVELSEHKDKWEKIRRSLEAHFTIGVTPNTPDSRDWKPCVPNGIEDRSDGPAPWWTGPSGCDAGWEEYGQDDVRWDLKKGIRFTSHNRNIVPTLAAVTHLIKLVEEHFARYARDGKLNYLGMIGSHVLPAHFRHLSDGSNVCEQERANQRQFYGQFDPAKLISAAEVLYRDM